MSADLLPPATPPDLEAEILARIAEKRALPAFQAPPAVSETYPHKPLPMEESSAAEATTHPLKIVDASSGGIVIARVLAGELGSFTVANADLTMTAGNWVIYYAVPMTWNEGSAIWSGDTGASPTLGKAASLPTGTTGLMYVKIGEVSVSAGRMTITMQSVSGNQTIARTGDDTYFTDANVKR